MRKESNPPAAERFYRTLLLAYPAEFRDEYGGEMVRLFRNRRREEGRRGFAALAALWLHVFADIGITAPREHFDMFSQDIRYCLRNFAHAPAFVAVAVLSLALGIGANTAIFSLVDTVLMKMLPVKDPQQLYVLSCRFPEGGETFNLSYPKFREFEARNGTLSGLFAAWTTAASLRANGATERVTAELVTGGYFSVLGVEAAAGRTLTPDDDRTPGAHPLAVLSHRYWMNRFNGDPAVLGTTVFVNGRPFTVVGVSTPGFHGLQVGSDPDIRVPMMMQPVFGGAMPLLVVSASRWLQIVGRLKPGIDERQAEAEMNTLYRGMIAADYGGGVPGAPPDALKSLLNQRLVLSPAAKGYSYLRYRLTRPLLVLMAMVGFILLIACANLANLMLARTTARRKEIAVRLALGASRPRVVRQVLTESLLLSLGGGVLGLVLSFWARDLLTGFLIDSGYAAALAIRPDWRLMAFTAAVTILTGILFGLAPAFKATRAGLAATLKDESGRGAGSGRWRLQKALVVAQVSLCLPLLAGAALFARTLGNLRAVDSGLSRDRILLASMDLGLSQYKPEAARAFYARLLERVRGLPGVRAASLSSTPLLSGEGMQNTVSVEGHTPKPGENVDPFFNVVTPGYFDCVGIRLLLGRDFTDRDTKRSPNVAVVNESFARQFLPGMNPVGRRFGMEGPDGKAQTEIVGVVKDAKDRSPRRAAGPAYYLPEAQMPWTEVTLHVRTSGDPARLLPAVQREIQALDRNLPLYNVHTLERQLDNLLAQERLLSLLSGFFGFLALLLAGIGLYGVISYATVQRTREMGVRMALGATPGGVLRLVLKDTILLLAAGMALGIPAACWLLQSTEALLFQIKPLDPAAIAAAAGVLVSVALVAGYLPARRATRVDPVTALRCE